MVGHQNINRLWSKLRSLVQVASACFIQPPLCYVGLTEEEAKAQLKGDLDVYVSKFKPLKNTLTGREEKTLMKMIVHPESDEASLLRPPGNSYQFCLPGSHCASLTSQDLH